MQTVDSRTGPESGPLWITVPAICGAVAALSIPGIRNTPTAGATLLAVGALALIAGHSWGAWLAWPSHLVVVANLLPTFSLQPTVRPVAVAIVTLTALPAMAVACVLVSQLIAREVVPHGQRARAAVLAAVLGLLGTVLLLPVQ